MTYPPMPADKTDLVRARIYASDASHAANVAYWKYDNGGEFNFEAMTEAFYKLADVLGYDVVHRDAAPEVQP